MKGKLEFLLIGILILLSFGNFYLGYKINYPPYEDELTTLFSSQLAISQPTSLKNLLGEEQYSFEKFFPLRNILQIPFGTSNIINLRTINFFFFLASLIVFYFFLKEIGWTSKTAIISLIPITISPLSLSLWLFRPKICLTVFLIIFWLYFWSRKKTNDLNIIFLIVTLFLLFYSSIQGLGIGLLIFAPLTIFKLKKVKRHYALLILGIFLFLIIFQIINNSALKIKLTQTPLYDAFNLKRIAQQINERIINEDNLRTRVIFPLWFRRMGYNKVFFTYQNFIKEILGFFDLETIFFQEVHPTHQKSEVIFFWPTIFLFFFGLLELIKNRFAEKQKILLLLIFISLIFYLLTANDSPASRHIFTLFSLAIVIGMGLKQIPKGITLIIILLIIWAVFINSYDVLKRPLYWYDNRPYVYAEGIKTLREIEPESASIENVYLTSLVGNPRLYYFYYFSPKPELFLKSPLTIEENGKKIHFTSFDLKNNPLQKNSLYFGFLGEFIGPNSINQFSEQDINKIKPMGLKVEKVWKLDNTIAYRYGDYFVFALTKD